VPTRTHTHTRTHAHTPHARTHASTKTHNIHTNTNTPHTQTLTTNTPHTTWCICTHARTRTHAHSLTHTAVTGSAADRGLPGPSMVWNCICTYIHSLLPTPPPSLFLSPLTPAHALYIYIYIRMYIGYLRVLDVAGDEEGVDLVRRAVGGNHLYICIYIYIYEDYM
jgi:hypothetical protein